MKLNTFIQKIGARAPFLGGAKHQSATRPTLGESRRFPYGPFRFKTQLPKGREFTVHASTDLRTWTSIGKGIGAEDKVEYIDSEAFKFSYRFYRLQTGELWSLNVIGYASVSLPPGFSMIANPFDSADTIGEVLKGWPDGTTLNKFDTRLFRLTENAVKQGKWTDPDEKLLHGEGAIFFNPTSDYKSASFTGEVIQGHLALPIPAGFSVRSSLVPQAGNLVDDLGFPITNGDVIHIFDRERQKYLLHPYENAHWPAGPPVVSVGESFWVAKTEPGNWIRRFTIEG